MKLTYEQLLDGWDSMLKLANGDIPSLRAQYAVSRAYGKLREAVDPLIKLKEDLIRKYKNIDKKTGIATLKEDVNEEEWDQEWKEFLESEAEVDIYKIKFAELENARLFFINGKETHLPPQEIYHLRFWIDDNNFTASQEAKKPKLMKKEGALNEA